MGEVVTEPTPAFAADVTTPKEALYLQEPHRVPHSTLRSRNNPALSPRRDRDPERQCLTVWWHHGS